MTSEVIHEIESALARSDGWCEMDKAMALAVLVYAIKPKLVIEIGVYGGRSLQAFAIPMKHLEHGCVIGIDPWDREASLAGMEDQANIDFWSTLDHERIFRRCLENISLSDLGVYAKIIRQKSDDVDPSQWQIDVVHIDGSHEETAFRDITRYCPHVRVNGFAVLDDIQWISGAPKRGVEWMLAHGFMEVYPLGTGAVFKRVC